MAGDTLRSAWHRMMRLWRPMAAWTVVTWALVAVPLIPLSSFVLGWDVLRGSRVVVGNEELLTWGLTIPGIAWGLLAGGFGIMAAVVRYAGIFHIISDDLRGRTPGLRQTALDLAPRLPALYRLCVVSVAGAAALALPVAAGLVAIKVTVLGRYDINYYLTARPPEWRLALALGAGWILLVGLPALWVAARSALALPAYLDGHQPLRSALTESWARTRGAGARVGRTLGLAVAAWLLGRAAAGWGYVALGSAAVSTLGALTRSLQALVLASAAYVLGLLILDALLAFTGFAFVSTVLTKAYYEDTDLHTRAPPPITLQDLPSHIAARVQAAVRPRTAMPVGALLLLVSAGTSGLLIGRVPEPRPVIVTAHRGGPPPAPENTLAALERAVEAGADWAEVDVQRTRDGTVVAVHDADLMRMAGDPRRIREATYAELENVVQHPDDGSPPAERRVATLAEILRRSEDRIGILIELKYYGDDPGLAPAVVQTVRAAGMSGEVRIMSLDYGAVRQVERLAPRVATGYVAAAAVGDIGRLPVDFIAVARNRVTPRLIRTARGRGLEVHAWTVNTAAEMADLMERGVDGLITDDPALARRVSREMTQLSPASRLLLRFRDLWDDETPPEGPLPDARDGAGVEPTPLLD